jgi:hypothetical protein
MSMQVGEIQELGSLGGLQPETGVVLGVGDGSSYHPIVLHNHVHGNEPF